MEDIGLDFSGCAEGLSVEANLNLDVSLETCFQNGGDVSSQVPEMGGLQLPINRLARQLLQSRAPRTNQLGGVVLQAPGASGAPVAPLHSRAPRTNHLGGVVLQTPGASGVSGAPGAPGAPLQTLTPSQQALHSSLTAIHNPGYQLQPGYHAHPVHFQQPLAAGISVTHQGVPLQPVQPMNHVQQTTAVPGYQLQPGYHAHPVHFQQPLAAGISVTHQGVPLQPVQPMNHVQQTTAVVSGVMPVQRPGPVVIPQIPPSNWMGLSIFSVIFFTLPFGIIALLFSFLVNDSYRRGQYEKARKNSEIAKWMNVLAIISGTILSCVVLYLIIRANNEI